MSLCRGSIVVPFLGITLQDPKDKPPNRNYYGAYGLCNGYVKPPHFSSLTSRPVADTLEETMHGACSQRDQRASSESLGLGFSGFSGFRV